MTSQTLYLGTFSAPYPILNRPHVSFAPILATPTMTSASIWATPRPPLPRTSSFETIPFHHNLTLSQLFDATSLLLSSLYTSLNSTSHQVIQRRIDHVDDTLHKVASDFCTVPANTPIPPETLYLLLLMLQKLYDQLHHYLIKLSSANEITETHLTYPPTSALLTSPGETLPHGQVHVSLEKLVAMIDITDDESDRIDEFVYQVSRRIHRSTKNTSALEKVVLSAEMWIDEFMATKLYTFPDSLRRNSTSVGISNPVKYAMGEIKRLLEMKEISSRNSSPAPESSEPRKSEQFLWADLHSGGDGSGKVYKIRAKDLLSWDGDYYACKVVRQTRANPSLSDLESEIHAIKKLTSGYHTHIVRVLDTWTEQNAFVTTFYVQMELCDGDLSSYLQMRYGSTDQEPLKVSEVWNVFRQIMEGVQYIHSQGMVHRDLKPKNILYTEDSTDALTWKITDFGFAAPSSLFPTFKPLTFGQMTRNYCAPELLISSRYTFSSDIWSCGCILYELATGIAPFETDEGVREYAWSGSTISKVSGYRDVAEEWGTMGAEWSCVDELVGRMVCVDEEMRPSAERILRDIPVFKELE